MRQAGLWRRAAGVADYVGNGAPGCHYGRWLCLNCPRDHHDPPFLPFRLPIHIREHRRRFSDHAIAWWCWDHVATEEVHTSGWRWVYDPVMSHDSELGEEMRMCTYRRVKVIYPDRRELTILQEEDRDAESYCSMCRLSAGGFRRRQLTPHDDLGHLELYQGAQVIRGRRLSEAQSRRIREAQFPANGDRGTYQVSLPGVLVDPGRHL